MEELCYAETRLPGVQIVEKAHVQRQVGKTARGGGGGGGGAGARNVARRTSASKHLEPG